MLSQAPQRAIVTQGTVTVGGSETNGTFGAGASKTIFYCTLYWYDSIFTPLGFFVESQVSKRAQIKGGSLWHRWVNLLRAKRILLKREGMHITSVSKVRTTIFIFASLILPARTNLCTSKLHQKNILFGISCQIYACKSI